MIFGIFSGGLAGATASQDLQVFTVASRRVLAPVYSKIGRRICAGLVIAPESVFRAKHCRKIAWKPASLRVSVHPIHNVFHALG